MISSYDMTYSPFFIPSAIARKADPLPDAEVLKAANDSILTDAYALYLHEKIAWVPEDVHSILKSSDYNDKISIFTQLINQP